jgi:hypothetical protein
MNIWHRRIVYVFFIGVFLIVAPLIILYTQGYRYNFERRTVQKTGIMIVSSIPRKADIYLNNTRYAERQTPAKIERVLPGDYEIRLEKEGYHTWQKRLPVFENGSTFAEKVILWKKSMPTIISSTPITAWQQQAGRGEIALLDSNGSLSTLSPERAQITSATNINANEPRDLKWSASQKKILSKIETTQNTQCEIISFEIFKNPTIQKLPPEYINCFWDYSNDAIIYGAKKNKGLWRFDTFTKNEQLVGYATNTNALLIKDNIIYSHDGASVWRQNITNALIEKITDIACVKCQLIQTNSHYLLLQDADREQIHFINENNQQKIATISAKSINWLSGSVLLFYNNWEIWIYDLNKDQPELITRFGTPVISAVWHPEGRHIFLTTNNEIKVIELDNRELRNIITLATTTDQQYLAIDRKGKFLYYNDKLADTQSSALHQLILQ